MSILMGLRCCSLDLIKIPTYFGCAIKIEKNLSVFFFFWFSFYYYLTSCVQYGIGIKDVKFEFY